MRQNLSLIDFYKIPEKAAAAMGRQGSLKPASWTSPMFRIFMPAFLSLIEINKFPEFNNKSQDIKKK
jgi:hypothetical protein